MSFVGPALPPHLRKGQEDHEEEKAEEGNAVKEEENLCGPVLPPYLWKRPEDDSVSGEADAEEEQSYGPALPPHLSQKKNESDGGKRIVGPALPPGFAQLGSNGQKKADQDTESDDEVIIGPLPPGVQPASYSAADELEHRAHTMKNKLTKKDEVEQPTRETWMLELPEVRSQAFGLGPRTFNRVTKPEIVGREEWTQAPNSEKPPKSDDKKEKGKEEALLRQAQERKRNAELEAVIKDHDSKRRKETLMEIHDKERKRKLKEEGQSVKERVPFDREKDLQTNRLDEAKRKAFLQRSKQLDGRFAGGSQKFL